VSQSVDGAGYLDEELGEMNAALAMKPSRTITRVLRENLAAFERAKETVATPCAMDWAWKTRRTWNGDECKRLVAAGTAGGPLGYLAPVGDADSESARRLHWPLAVQRHWGAWNGPVYLLTDAKTYSAAEMFTAVMRDNSIARTVGDTTGRAGCGFMIDTNPVVLPHSQLRFRIPNCVRLRADGSDEVAGIAPDLPLLPAENEDRRAWAARILVAVGADLHARADDRESR